VTVPPARQLGRDPATPIRVAILLPQLIYSDDYLDGWKWGFEQAGCKVELIDISYLHRLNTSRASIYSTGRQGHFAKDVAQLALRGKPDLVWAHHGRAAGSNQIFMRTLARSGVPSAVYLCDEPYEIGETIKYSPQFDWVFTMDPCTLGVHKRARAKKDRVFYLPPAVNPDHFKLVPYPNRRSPRQVTAFFLGNASLVPRPDYFKPVERVVDGADIRFWETVGKHTTNKWIPLEQHPALYGNCKLALNVHRDPRITKECFLTRVKNRKPNQPIPNGLVLCKTPDGFGTGFWNDANLPAAHVNPRFFEMAACGTLVVSDNHRTELNRLFPFAPQASNPDHFLELVLYYLDHEDEAEQIGKACYYQTLMRHTYLHRALEVLIRLGFTESLKASRCSSLVERPDWLTPQDFNEQGVRSSSAQTGPSEPWSPAYGRSLIEESGIPSGTGSLDLTTPWSR
jgi:spore maturation protein CgeB